jgi:hypothetical protein
MQWTAKHFDNVYLLTDEHPSLANDLVVYVSPEDKTVVIDHEAINHEVIGERTKVLWSYEPGKKLAGKTSYVYIPMTTRVEARTIAQDLVPVQPMSPERSAQYSMLNRYSDTEVDERYYIPITMIKTDHENN